MKVRIKRTSHRDLEKPCTIDTCCVEETGKKTELITIPLGKYLLKGAVDNYPEKLIVKSKEDVKDS